jgi:hypothetical protein
LLPSQGDECPMRYRLRASDLGPRDATGQREMSFVQYALQYSLFAAS